MCLHCKVPDPEQMAKLDDFDLAFLTMTGHVAWLDDFDAAFMMMKAASSHAAQEYLWGPEAALLGKVLTGAWETVGPAHCKRLQNAFDMSGDGSVDMAKLRKVLEDGDRVGRAMWKQCEEKVHEVMEKTVNRAANHFTKNAAQLQKKVTETQWKSFLASANADHVKMYTERFPDRMLHPEVERLARITQDSPRTRMIGRAQVEERLGKINVMGDNYFGNVSDVQAGRTWTFTGVQVAHEQGVEEYMIVAEMDKNTCPVCERLHGKRFSVGAAHGKMVDELERIAPGSSDVMGRPEFLNPPPNGRPMSSTGEMSNCVVGTQEQETPAPSGGPSGIVDSSASVSHQASPYVDVDGKYRRYQYSGENIPGLEKKMLESGVSDAWTKEFLDPAIWINPGSVQTVLLESADDAVMGGARWAVSQSGRSLTVAKLFGHPAGGVAKDQIRQNRMDVLKEVVRNENTPGLKHFGVAQYGAVPNFTGTEMRAMGFKLNSKAKMWVTPWEDAQKWAAKKSTIPVLPSPGPPMAVVIPKKVPPVAEITSGTRQQRKEVLDDLVKRGQGKVTPKQLAVLEEATDHIPTEVLQNLNKRGIEIRWTNEAGAYYNDGMKAIVLGKGHYRSFETISHEFGHAVDYLASGGNTMDWKSLGKVNLGPDDAKTLRKAMNQWTRGRATKKVHWQNWEYYDDNWVHAYDGKVYNGTLGIEWWGNNSHRYAAYRKSMLDMDKRWLGLKTNYPKGIPKSELYDQISPVERDWINGKIKSYSEMREKYAATKSDWAKARRAYGDATQIVEKAYLPPATLFDDLGDWVPMAQ